MFWKMINVSFIPFMLLRLTSVFAGTPAVTSTQEIFGGELFTVAKHAWTATTSRDSVLVGNSIGKPIIISELPENTRNIVLQFKNAETTAASVDKIVVWYVSNLKSPDYTIATTAAALLASGWIEVKRDTFANTLQFRVAYDVDLFPGAKVIALIDEAANNTAVAETAYIYYPKRAVQFRKQ